VLHLLINGAMLNNELRSTCRISSDEHGEAGFTCVLVSHLEN
jgi:hypothetical protein